MVSSFYNIKNLPNKNWLVQLVYKIKLMHKVNKNILSPLILSKNGWHFCIAFQIGRHN